MPLVLLLLASWLEPRCPLVRSQVDLIELNHFYNDDGGLCFHQYVFWKWDQQLGYRVQAYRVLKGQFPGPCRHGSGYRARWCDNGVARDVTAPYFRETWTQYDPELEDCTRFPKEFREDLPW
jgi:hypothetical protein